MARELITLALLAAGCLTLGGCQSMQAVDQKLYQNTRPTASGARFDFATRKEEINKGNSAVDQILGEVRSHGGKVDGELIGEQPYTKLKEFSLSIVSVTPYHAESWDVHVIPDPSWNAFTTGGTQIVYHLGILQDKSMNKCELAHVVGHEVAHVVLGHASKHQTDQLLLTVAGRGRQARQLAPMYTTQAEADADRYGTLFATLAGYDPQCAVNVWNRMFATAGNNADNYRYDHPLPSDRAQALAQLAAKYRSYYIGPAQSNPDADKIITAELYGGRAPGAQKYQGEGIVQALAAAANSAADYKRAKADDQTRQLLAARHENIRRSLALVAAQKTGPQTVTVRLANRTPYPINDLFSLSLTVQGQPPVTVVRQVNGGIPPNSQVDLHFTDPALGPVYLSPGRFGIAVDSVTAVR
jgi:predicted Zn-dependent protease